MAELAASQVVAPLVSLLKEKVYVQLAPGPVQHDGGQGRCEPGGPQEGRGQSSNECGHAKGRERANEEASSRGHLHA